jgi:hypothetical protein
MSPEELFQTLIEFGIPSAHAEGMLANAIPESGLNPAAIGDSGTSGGLFQHHGDRFAGLQAFAEQQGKSWKDPAVQVQYTLSEPDTKAYLAQSFASPQDASMWFTKNWERPANADQKAVERAQAYATPQVGQNVTNQAAPMDTTAQYQGQPDPYADPYAQDQMPQQRQPGMLESWLSNPLTQIGMGMLMSPGNYGNPMPALGYGMARAADSLGQQRALENEMFALQQKRKEWMSQQRRTDAKDAANLSIDRSRLALQQDEWATKRGDMEAKQATDQDLMAKINALPEPYKTMALLNPSKAAEYLGNAAGLKPEVDLDKLRLWRGDVQKEVAPYQSASSAAQQLQVFMENPGAFGDIGVVYNLVKSLDPTSVVREGEVGLMQSAMPLYDKLIVGIKKIQEGGAIGPALKENIVANMAELMKLYEKQAGSKMGYWREFSSRHGIDPNDLGVGTDIAFPTFMPTSAEPPPAGKWSIKAR